jgi:hypothetical protein
MDGMYVCQFGLVAPTVGTGATKGHKKNTIFKRTHYIFLSRFDFFECRRFSWRKICWCVLRGKYQFNHSTITVKPYDDQTNGA